MLPSYSAIQSMQTFESGKRLTFFMWTALWTRNWKPGRNCTEYAGLDTLPAKTLGNPVQIYQHGCPLCLVCDSLCKENANIKLCRYFRNGCKHLASALPNFSRQTTAFLIDGQPNTLAIFSGLVLMKEKSAKGGTHRNHRNAKCKHMFNLVALCSSASSL